MSDQVLFEAERVRITLTKAQFDGTTYPLAGITSVTSRRESDSPLSSVLMLIFGLLLLLSSGLYLLFTVPMLFDAEVRGLGLFCLFPLSAVCILGALFVLGGIAKFYTLGTDYVVLIGTAGGERRALVTSEEALAESVRRALEDAITKRG